MKKQYGGISIASLLMLYLLGGYLMKYSIKESYQTSPPNFNTSEPLESTNPAPPNSLFNPKNFSRVISNESLVSDSFSQKNLSNEEQISLQTWNRLIKQLATHAHDLPNGIEAINEGDVTWKKLMFSIEQEKLQSNGSLPEKQFCPHFLSKMNASEINDDGFKLGFPCGLTEGSSITFIGIPFGDFQVELSGEPPPGKKDPPIILHYNIVWLGDGEKNEDPVIIQNTWTDAHDWGREERCPSPNGEKNYKVDDLYQCHESVGKENNQTINANHHTNRSTDNSTLHNRKSRKYFPFKQNELFVATLRVGFEGFQMTVHGKQITSFAFRETLEPWLVSEVSISGDVNLISVVASNLPTSENFEPMLDLEDLKAVTLSTKKELNLFVGVFSTANNFRRRMALRRSWMQYPQVRSGQVAIRFFVGLHKIQLVNDEVWQEARTYGDIQLMPFVDYYSIITWKTIAICLYGTEVVSARFILKADDDSFVRIDEILNSLCRINVTRGLLYGRINPNSVPERDPNKKWYITPEEWPDDKFPPWANGPGYVVSSDVAKMVSKKHRKGRLKIFKLEDVAMGIWVANMKKNKKGLEVRYEKDDRIYEAGCKDGYVVAHYQGPRKLLCLWKKIQEEKRAICCED